ncbi:MAG TPA: FAD-binding oxidoreductase [Chiayiivirga sp.]|nr:FAD-binding oxidoreductase [Chiayiivirga sp.]
MQTDIAIIGSGIVGLSCAFHLQRAGAQCLLIDPKGAGQGASFGNAGAISFGNIFPQATPGIAWQGLRMLFDADAPLKLDWGVWPEWIGWVRAFVRAGESGQVERAVLALHAINSQARAAWLELAEAIGALDLLAESGYLHVYSEASSFAADAWKRRWFKQLGIRHRVLDARDLSTLEPALGADFSHGVLQEESLGLRDPGGFCQRLAEALKRQGVEDLPSRVRDLKRAASGYVLTTDHGELLAQRVVVAAGSGSKALLAPLGLKLPIIAGRGYHLMYPPQAGLLRRPTLWIERHIVLSPMRGGMRLAGLKELTRPDREPHFEYILRRQADARRLCPDLAGVAVSRWVGDRPVTPDSLPIIDALDEGRLLIATGHGHLGMTQGPITGRWIAELAAGSAACLPLAPFAVRR